MAAIFPQNFPLIGPSALANYNYTDVDEGTGVVIYYGAVDQSGGILTRYSIYSDISGTDNNYVGITSFLDGTQTAYTEFVTKNFDVKFNLARTIKGNLHAVVPIGKNSTAAADMKTFVEVYHLDASSNATLLVSGSSLIFSPGLSGLYSASSVQTLNVPEKHFASGESLRIKVRLWGRSPSAANTNYGIAHDPQNRPDRNGAASATIATTTDTIMQIHVPFKLDDFH